VDCLCLVGGVGRGTVVPPVAVQNVISSTAASWEVIVREKKANLCR